jgi:hypothetical protein
MSIRPANTSGLDPLALPESRRSRGRNEEASPLEEVRHCMLPTIQAAGRQCPMCGNVCGRDVTECSACREPLPVRFVELNPPSAGALLAVGLMIVGTMTTVFDLFIALAQWLA